MLTFATQKGFYDAKDTYYRDAAPDGRRVS